MAPPGHFPRADNSKIYNKLVISAQRPVKTSQAVLGLTTHNHHTVTSKSSHHLTDTRTAAGLPRHSKSDTQIQKSPSDLFWTNTSMVNGSSKVQTVVAENLTRKQRPIFSSASSWRDKRDLESLSATSLPGSLSPPANRPSNPEASAQGGHFPVMKHKSKTSLNRDRCSGSEKKAPCSADVNGHMTFSETSLSSAVHAMASSTSKRVLARSPHKILGTALIHPRPSKSEQFAGFQPLEH